MGGVHALAGTVLDATPATALALVAAMLVTGALHEDGLADAADAIGAHVPRERRLEILRDSRVGTYGALALVFAVVFPLVVLDAARRRRLPARRARRPRRRALVDPPAVAAAAGGAARRRGRADARRRPRRPPWRAPTRSAIALVAGRPAAGAVALGVGALLTGSAVLLFRRTLGGATGDTFGALMKVVELACYAALVAMWA